MASGGLPQWRGERLLGPLTDGARLGRERQPRGVVAGRPSLVLGTGFAEPVDQPDQWADIQSIPKLFDIGMRLAPATDECLDFILGTIRLKFAPSARSAGITKSEIGSFADAALRVV